MSTARIITCILIMAVVTYLIRMLPLAVFRTRITNRTIRSFLAYVPYAVLGAMIFPDVFYSTENLLSALVGLGIALLLSWFGRGLLTVALGSAAAVFAAEQVMRMLA